MLFTQLRECFGNLSKQHNKFPKLRDQHKWNFAKLGGQHNE